MAGDVLDFGDPDSVRVSGVENAKELVVVLVIEGELDFVGRNLEDLLLMRASRLDFDVDQLGVAGGTLLQREN